MAFLLSETSCRYENAESFIFFQNFTTPVPLGPTGLNITCILANAIYLVSIIFTFRALFWC